MKELQRVQDWLELYPAPVTICDAHGVIVAMNYASQKNFARRGGGALIGTSLFDCHPPAANKKIQYMLQNQKAETYIVERKGKKRLVHQAPWYKEGKFAGLMETIIDLSDDIEIRRKD